MLEPQAALSGWPREGRPSVLQTALSSGDLEAWATAPTPLSMGQGISLNQIQSPSPPRLAQPQSSHHF